MPPERERQDVREGYVAVGRVLGAFGVRGDLKLQPLAPPEVFAKGRTVHLNAAPRVIERSRAHGKILHLKLSGIDVREAAAALRGLYLEVQEADLPPPGEDTYYHYQLVGMRVVSTEGEEIGEIVEVISTGGNDVFVVRGPERDVLVPGVDEIVRAVDVAGRRMVIEVVPGLMD